jgi:hypothetical protein
MGAIVNADLTGEIWKKQKLFWFIKKHLQRLRIFYIVYSTQLKSFIFSLYALFYFVLAVFIDLCSYCSHFAKNKT